MTVYCDTSFLVSFFCEADDNHKPAVELAGRHRAADFLICEVHQIEFPAAVRAAVHREKCAIPEPLARTLINRFDRSINSRLFQRKNLDLRDSVEMTRRLGDSYGWGKKFTSFDLWHLGSAWTFSASVFLTFDSHQKAIAREIGMA